MMEGGVVTKREKENWHLQDDYYIEGEKMIFWSKKGYKPSLAEILRAKKKVFEKTPYSQLIFDWSGYEGEENFILRKISRFDVETIEE